MNILNDPWLKTDAGTFSPLELATWDTGAAALLLPREDWEIGAYELLIGIAARLRAESADAIAPEFEATQFMQRDPTKGRGFGPEFLLIDAMNGGSRFWDYKAPLAGHEALLALYTFQSRATAGGRGYSTSLRGGSALTVMRWGDTVWERIQANLLHVPDWRPLFWTPRAIRLEWDGARLSGVHSGPDSAQTDMRHPLCAWGTDRVRQMPEQGLNYASIRSIDPRPGNHVLLAGFEMDNMKPISWTKKTWRFDPAYLDASLERYGALRTLFSSALRTGKYSDHDPRAKSDRHVAEFARLHEETEPGFISAISDGDIPRYTEFAKARAIEIYERSVQLDANPRRYVEGLKILKNLKIFTDRPPQEERSRRRRKAA